MLRLFQNDFSQTAFEDAGYGKKKLFFQINRVRNMMTASENGRRSQCFRIEHQPRIRLRYEKQISPAINIFGRSYP